MSFFPGNSSRILTLKGVQYTALVVHTGRRPATMEFGSSFLLAGAPLGDLEDIYKDDVNDGIASMAKEQAEYQRVVAMLHVRSNASSAAAKCSRRARWLRR